MTMVRPFVILAVGLVVLTACSDTEPYLYNPALVDRSAVGFNKPLALEDGIVVCHSSGRDDIKKVVALAQAECARAGLVAVFQSTTYTLCPADKISGEKFLCLDPTAGSQIIHRTPFTGNRGQTPPGAYDTDRPQ